MFPPEGSGLGIWGSFYMLYIRVPSRTQGSHPQSTLLKAGLPFPCWAGEESNYQIPERLGYSCVGSLCQSRVSSHSEHWCWPLPLGHKLISCSALFSWPVFVWPGSCHKVQMEGCPLVLVSPWAVCCEPGAFCNRTWAAAFWDEARVIPGTAGESKLSPSQFLLTHGKAGGRMGKKPLSDYSSCMCFGRENTA